MPSPATLLAAIIGVHFHPMGAAVAMIPSGGNPTPQALRALFNKIRPKKGNPSNVQLLALFAAAEGKLSREQVKQILKGIEFQRPVDIDTLIERFTEARRGSGASGRTKESPDLMQEMQRLLEEVESKARADAVQDPRLPLLNEIPHDHSTVFRELITGGEIEIPDAYVETARDLFFSGEEWMQRALYDPKFGFYATGFMKFGTEFTTQPVGLSPLYGAMVCEQIYRLWSQMDQKGTLDKTRPFEVIETAAGAGQLSSDILAHARQRALDSKSSGAEDAGRRAEFYYQLKYTAVDMSPSATQSSTERGREFIREGKLQVLQGDGIATIEALRAHPIQGVFLSNEWFDNLIAHQIRLTKDGRVQVALFAPAVSLEAWEMLRMRGIVKHHPWMVHLLHQPVNYALFSKEDLRGLQEALLKPEYHDLGEALKGRITIFESYVDARYFPAITSYYQLNHEELDRALQLAPGSLTGFAAPIHNRIVQAMAAALDRGYVLIFDYFRPTSEAFDATKDQTLIFQDRTRRIHPVFDLGRYDITYLPDSTNLVLEGQKNGLRLLYEGPNRVLEQRSGINLDAPESREQLVEKMLPLFLNKLEELHPTELLQELVGFPGLAVRDLMDALTFYTKAARWLRANRPSEWAEFLPNAEKIMGDQIASFRSEDHFRMLLLEKVPGTTTLDMEHGSLSGIRLARNDRSDRDPRMEGSLEPTSLVRKSLPFTPTNGVESPIRPLTGIDKENYDHWQSDRDITRPALAALVRKLMKANLPANATVLEVGTGPGHDLQKLAAGGLPIHWISTDQVRWSEEDKVATLPGLPQVADHSVDAVVGIAVLDTIREKDLAASFAGMSRILKPGGKIIQIVDLSPAAEVTAKDVADQNRIPIFFSEQERPRSPIVRKVVFVHRGQLFLNLPTFKERRITIAPDANGQERLPYFLKSPGSYMEAPSLIFWIRLRELFEELGISYTDEVDVADYMKERLDKAVVAANQDLGAHLKLEMCSAQTEETFSKPEDVKGLPKQVKAVISRYGKRTMWENYDPFGPSVHGLVRVRASPIVLVAMKLSSEESVAKRPIRGAAGEYTELQQGFLRRLLLGFLPIGLEFPKSLLEPETIDALLASMPFTVEGVQKIVQLQRDLAECVLVALHGEQSSTGPSDSDLPKDFSLLFGQEHSAYHEAVLDKFVRDEESSESLGYTAGDNYPLNYQDLWTQVYKYAGDIRGERVLEFGPGPGVSLERLRNVGGVDVTGIEADPRFVTFAQKHGIPLIEGDMRTIPQSLIGQTFRVTYSRLYLDALAGTEDLLGRQRRGLMSHKEKLQVLDNLAVLTAPGGWSIHETRYVIPFTDVELRAAGFEIVGMSPERRFVVLRKLPIPEAERTSVLTAAPADSKSFSGGGGGGFHDGQPLEEFDDGYSPGRGDASAHKATPATLGNSNPRPGDSLFVRGSKNQSERGSSRLPEILFLTTMCGIVVLVFGGTLFPGEFRAGFKAIESLFIHTPLWELLMDGAVGAFAVRGTYQYLHLEKFPRYALPFHNLPESLRDELIGWHWLETDPDKFGKRITMLLVAVVKTFVNPFIYCGSLMEFAARSVGPGYFPFVLAGSLALNNIMWLMLAERIVGEIRDRDKLLKFVDQEIDLLGVSPEDLKIKAIGYRLAFNGWKPHHEFVLWMKEPYVLRWVGLIFPIPVYIVPQDGWTPIKQAAKNWITNLRVGFSAKPATIPINRSRQFSPFALRAA